MKNYFSLRRKVDRSFEHHLIYNIYSIDVSRNFIRRDWTFSSMSSLCYWRWRLIGYSPRLVVSKILFTFFVLSAVKRRTVAHCDLSHTNLLTEDNPIHSCHWTTYRRWTLILFDHRHQLCHWSRRACLLVMNVHVQHQNVLCVYIALSNIV